MNSRNKDGTFAKHTQNSWKVNGDVAECYLNGELLFFTDAKNIEELKKHSWFKYANGYYGTLIQKKQIGVHQLLKGIHKGKVIDHINRNKKDNRLCNLRIVDKSQNAFNTDLRINNSSGVTGVRYRKDTNRWTAEIKKHGKKHCLGCFATIEEATEARRKAEILYYGD